MPLRPPDHRAQALIASAKTLAEPDTQEPIEREFFHLVKTHAHDSYELSQAVGLYADEEYRHIMGALLLTNVNEESLCAMLGLSEAVLGVYRHLFFDTSVFPHNLARTRFVKELNCRAELKALYELAIERGPNELLERYRIGIRPAIDPEIVMKDALGDMWGKFLSHRGYSVTSDTAKEALRWGEAALRTAKVVLDTSREERKGASTVDDLRIALEIKSETKTLSELGLQADELVVE